MAQNESRTPKGTAPQPMRRATKRKRAWYSATLADNHADRMWRRKQAANLAAYIGQGVTE